MPETILAADVIETKDHSSLKLKFDCGLNEKGKTIMKSRSFSNVKSDAVALDLYNVAETIASLQKHTLFEVVKQDNTEIGQ